MENKELNEVEESEEKILDIEDSILENRIDIIRNILIKTSDIFRKNIKSESDEDLINNDNFKIWMINNLIIDQSLKEDNEEFNRLMYYMFEKSNKNVVKFLSNYDMKIDKVDNNFKFELIVNEGDQ